MATIQCSMASSLGLVAPYYNLALVITVIILLLIMFKRANEKTYIKPWKFLLLSISVFVIEEILTVLHNANILSIPNIVFPILETIIITSFIYMLLLQKEYLKNDKNA